MYLTPETIIDAYTECGMRNVQVSGINNFGPDPHVMEERFLKLNQKNSLSSYMLGLHAEYTCSMELLETIAAMVQKYKAPFFAHNSETELEVKECFERYGMSPTQLFDKLGLYDFGGGGYHLFLLRILSRLLFRDLPCSRERKELFRNRNREL